MYSVIGGIGNTQYNHQPLRRRGQIAFAEQAPAFKPIANI